MKADEPDADRHDGSPGDAPPIVQKIGSLVARVFMIGFGVVWLSGVGTGGSFIVKGIWRELRQPLYYEPVEAVVTAYTPPATTVDEWDKEQRTAGKIACAYSVGSARYEGTHDQPDHPRNEYDADLAGPRRPGEKLTAWVDPDEPSCSTLVPVAQPMLLGMLMFMMPFFAVGVGMIVGGLVGGPAVAKMSFGSGRRGRSASILSPALAAYTILSCVGAFAFFAASFFLDWRAGWVLGLALILLVWPLLAWRIGRHYARRRRLTEQQRAEAETFAGPEGGAVRPAPSAGPRSLADAPEEEVTREQYAKPAWTSTPASRWGPATSPSTSPFPMAAKAVPFSKGLGGPLFFTIFWCGLTGVFVGFVAYSFLKSAEVKARFRTTEGTVVASKIETHSGDDNDTYSPLIKYRYTVDGKEYTSKRYAYGQWSSSDYGESKEIVNAHPPGKQVTVYYDPDDPAEAVLSREIPEFMYFIVLFLQPFVMVGLGMIGYTATLPARNRRLRRFLETEPQPPWGIPSWGTLRDEMGAFSIRSRGHTPLLAVAMGYGLTSFLGTFAAAGLGFGLDWPFRPVVGAFLAGAAGIGLLAGGVSLVRRGRGARLEIDRNLGRLTLVTPKRQVEAKLSEVASWQVRGVPNPRKSHGPSEVGGLAPLLAAARTDGSEVPVHVFAANADGRAIADKAAAGLAELTGKPLAPVGGPGGEGAGPSGGSILEAVRASHKDLKAQRQAQREYADLT